MKQKPMEKAFDYMQKNKTKHQVTLRAVNSGLNDSKTQKIKFLKRKIADVE